MKLQEKIELIKKICRNAYSCSNAMANDEKTAERLKAQAMAYAEVFLILTNDYFAEKLGAVLYK